VSRHGSWNCPTMASARMTESIRYLSASSKPLMVRSNISCTDAGASTILR